MTAVWIILACILAWFAVSAVFVFGCIVAASVRGAGRGLDVCDEAERVELDVYALVAIA